MQKEEFPTFLNEQPTIIFGRTGRELLIIVCGIVGASALAAAAADATTSARISGVTGVASEIAGGAPRNFGANTVSVRVA